MARRTCRGLPGLKGYVGVDVVLTDTDAFVIEVNPRLTTSYLGVRASAQRERGGPRPARLRRYASAPCRGPRRRVVFTAAGRVRLGMTDPVLGWDIGGANVKAALVSARARSRACVERPFALWREPRELAARTRRDRGKPRRRAADGRHHDRRAGRLLRHEARGGGLRARRFRGRLSRREAAGLRGGRTLSLQRSRAGAAPPRRRRQLDGERDARGRGDAGRLLRRRRQHHHRHHSHRRRPRRAPRAHRRRAPALGRAGLHGSPAHARLRHRALRARPGSPLPRGRGALRDRGRRSPLARAHRRGRLRLRHARRAGPIAGGSGGAPGAHGLRRRRGPRSRRGDRDRGGRRAGAGARHREGHRAGARRGEETRVRASRCWPVRGRSWGASRRSAPEPAHAAPSGSASGQAPRAPSPRRRWRSCSRGEAEA